MVETGNCNGLKTVCLLASLRVLNTEDIAQGARARFEETGALQNPCIL